MAAGMPVGGWQPGCHIVSHCLHQAPGASPCSHGAEAPINAKMHLLCMPMWLMGGLPSSRNCAGGRRYVKSRDDAQLRGETRIGSQLTACEPERYLGGDSSKLIDPCGLVAWSTFNDTFQVLSCV